MTIREYVAKTLQAPLKKYRTPVQDAIIEIMIEYFQDYHIGIEELPSIINPDPVSSRYDIIDAIAKSYKFTIRPDAIIEEQVAILANIAYLYKLRGSIYSIEHMKELYGGNLPEPVHIDIPSYHIFRYCISPYDQTDVYQSGDHYRPGIYDVNIYRYFDNIEELINWMYRELVTSGALIKIINHINSGDTNTSDPDNLIPYSGNVFDLYNSNLYLTVVDDSDHIVALKSVDEFRYFKRVPSDYAVRILKYNDSNDNLLYYIDINDDSLVVEYGFSPNRVNEPINYTILSESAIIEPTNTYLWIKLTKGDSIKAASIDLKDEGENWYVQYALVDDGVLRFKDKGNGLRIISNTPDIQEGDTGLVIIDSPDIEDGGTGLIINSSSTVNTYYDWMEWTDQDILNPNTMIFTADYEEAVGLYIKTDLRGIEYPICTYKEIRLYKDPGINGDIMRSSYYSERGIDEYGNVGTLIATLELVYPVVRNTNMTDVLVMVLDKDI